MLFFFFFSSRRRHTRCSRDWSSDVCSSDLPALRPGAVGGNFGGMSLPARGRLHLSLRTVLLLLVVAAALYAGGLSLFFFFESARSAVSAVVTVLWLLLAVVFLPIALLLFRQRIDRPLKDLDAGLARVADGDLPVEVPVHRRAA